MSIKKRRYREMIIKKKKEYLININKNYMLQKLYPLKHKLTINFTRHEDLIRLALDKMCMPYVFQRGTICDTKAIRIVDFELPLLKIIIEVDGDTHDDVWKDYVRECLIKKSKSLKHHYFMRITNREVDNNINNLNQFLVNKFILIDNHRTKIEFKKQYPHLSYYEKIE